MAVSMIPKYVTIELLLHAAFVADEILGDTLEPARIRRIEDKSSCRYVLRIGTKTKAAGRL